MRHAVRGLALIVLPGAVLLGCATRPETSGHASVSIVPVPVSLEPRAGQFEMPGSNRLGIAAGGMEAARIARQFAELMQRARGLQVDVVDGAPRSDCALEFVLDAAAPIPAGDHDEGYDLLVTPQRIKLSARTPHGLFNASITLWQLMTAAQPANAVRIPALHIIDYPRFGWRGLLLDSARHFQQPEFIERFIDEMALHKLNVMHWHLTDDQGWRIEIKRYPKLTQIGAWRDPQPDEASLVDPASGKYGGYYTQQQIREIVAYAAARFVTIVPEIDMPGHAQAAVASYPQIGVTGKQPPVSADWGINAFIYNVDESTFAFIGNVLTEVLDLFPSPYIHVGGDEAAKDQWQASPLVQERMRRLGIRDEQALQGYFTARLEGFLSAHHRRLIGWDEILEGGLPAGAIVMSWRGSEGAVAAARHGDDVIMSPDPVMYLDHLQGEGADEPPGRIKVLSLADVYRFDPLPRELTPEQAVHVLGAQANLWSEYLTSPERVELAAFPRAAALAERLWSPQDRTGWRDFVARMPAQFERYRALGIGFSDDAFRPKISVDAGAGDTLRVTMSRQIETLALRYSVDGSEPRSDSRLYSAPFAVPAPTSVRAAAFDGLQRVSSVASTRVDASAVLRRSSDRLDTCGNSLLLRLEGSSRDGVAPLYDVDLMNPCWIYRRIDFAATARIDVRVGALPYFFQLWHDTGKVVRHDLGGDSAELQLHLDRCDGELLAALPLPPDRIAAQTLSIAAGAHAGVHDICMFFAQRGDDPLRLIDWVEAIPLKR